MGAAVVGLDLSLRATGIAHVDGRLEVVITNGMTGEARINRVRSAVLDALHGHVDLVVLEGYAHGALHQAHHMGELGGVVRFSLWQLGQRKIDLAPGTLKKYATGTGRASKTDMVVAARERFGVDTTDDNAADAYLLRAAGHHLLDDPLITLPVVHTSALALARKRLDAGNHQTFTGDSE